jgi:predicted PurR-regulated permease PerM
MSRVPGILIASGFLFLAISIAGILALGRNLFGPIAGAVVIWFVINASARACSRLRRVGTPGRVDTFLAVAVFCAASAVIGLLVMENAAELRDSAAIYNENLAELLRGTMRALGISVEPDLNKLVSSLNLQELFLSALGSVTDAVSSLVMVLLYVLFLFVEQAAFPKKLRALMKNDDDRAALGRKLSELQVRLEKYIGIKCLEGLLLGGCTLIMLKVYGVDFAALWAFAVFLISFIPTIGSIIGTALPILVTLMQFGEWGPALQLGIVLGVLQVLVNNVLEPKLLGTSFDLSPMVILIALAFGLEIWGVLGAVLAVPILVIATTICADFKPTRPIAVILSGGVGVD